MMIYNSPRINKRKIECPSAPKKRVRFEEPVSFKSNRELWGNDITEEIIIKLLGH